MIFYRVSTGKCTDAAWFADFAWFSTKEEAMAYAEGMAKEADSSIAVDVEWCDIGALNKDRTLRLLNDRRFAIVSKVVCSYQTLPEEDT